MIRNPISYLSLRKKEFLEKSKDKQKLPKTSNETSKPFVLEFFRSRSKNSKTEQTASTTKQFPWEKIGLTTDKPIPLEHIENALDTVKCLITSLTNLIKVSESLISDADFALRNTPRPTCSENCKVRCTGGSKCYREAIETFDRVIEAGGPMCFVEKNSKHKQFPSSYSYLKAPSKIRACPSKRDHEHLHVTNSHRILLENLWLKLAYLSKAYSQLRSFFQAYRKIPIRFDGNRQRSQDFAITKILDYWNDIRRVRQDYEWIWGGGYCLYVHSWEGFKAVCERIAEIKAVRINQLNLIILLRSDLAQPLNDINEKKVKKMRQKKQIWAWLIGNKKTKVLQLYPSKHRPPPTSPEPEPVTKNDWEEVCEQCERNIEETRNGREFAIGKKPESTKSSESLASSTCANAISREQLLHAVPQGLPQAFARALRKMKKAEDLTEKTTGRFTTKAKGKWRCEKPVSLEEELELYNRHNMPSLEELCNWCKIQKRSVVMAQSVS